MTEDEAGWLNRQQGYFGEKVVQTLAAAAGMSCAIPDIDVGTDLKIEDPDGEEARIQVKTTRVELPVIDGDVRFKLDIPTYDWLRKTTTVPRFLVVMEVRPFRRDWIARMEFGFIVRRRAWYVSLRGDPATENEDSVTVRLPFGNMVTTATLTRMTQGGMP